MAGCWRRHEPVWPPWALSLGRYTHSSALAAAVVPIKKSPALLFGVRSNTLCVVYSVSSEGKPKVNPDQLNHGKAAKPAPPQRRGICAPGALAPHQASPMTQEVFPRRGVFPWQGRALAHGCGCYHCSSLPTWALPGEKWEPRRRLPNMWMLGQVGWG